MIAAILLASGFSVAPTPCYSDTPLGSATIPEGASVARWTGLAIDRHMFEDMHPLVGAEFPMACQSIVTLSACGQDVATFETPVHVWTVSVGPFDGVLDYGGASGATYVHITAFSGSVPIEPWARCGGLYARCTSDLEFTPGIGAWALGSRMRVAGRLVVE